MSGYGPWIPRSWYGRGSGHEYNADRETHQVRHKAPEPHAVNCALEDLDAIGLGRVLLKRDVGSDAQTFVDPDWVGRSERMMAEMSSKCVHQSSGRVRLMCERSKVRRRPMISCWQRSSVAELTAKALFRRELCDACAPSVREASKRARSVEAEEMQRCVDTG